MKCPAVVASSLLLACTPSPEEEDTSGPPETGLPLTTTASASSGSGSGGGASGGTTGTDSGTTSDPDGGSMDDGPIFDLGTPDAPPPERLPLPQLWYSIEDALVYIELDPADGSVAQLVTSTITNEPPLVSEQPGDVEFSSVTMLDDGSLLGARGLAGRTQLFHVTAPPVIATDLEVVVLGDMDDALFLEALYTDCEGRVYLMDTGVHSSTSVGNRLLRFTGDYLGGDFSYEVITDLSVAVAADIDDMAPGIDRAGSITDNPGFAIDSGTLYDFDYTTGTGTALGMAGTYGVHALGGALFDDGVSRLYVMTIDAEIQEVDPVTLTVSSVLVTGPMVPGATNPGLAGIAGPLTDCRSGFPEG